MADAEKQAVKRSMGTRKKMGTRKTKTQRTDLTPKQEAFSRHYVETGNATEAYRRSYNAEKMSDEATRVEACRLLGNPNVALTVERLQRQVAERHDVTIDKVIRELALIGFSNMQDYIQTQEDGSAYVDLSNLTRPQAAAISEVTSETYMDGRGEDAREVKRTKIKLADKRAALVDLGKHLGMFKEIVEHTGKNGGPIDITPRPGDLDAARRVAFALGRALERQRMKVIDGEAG